MNIFKLEEVFGVSKNPIKSYLVRDKADGLFQDALKTDKQIIVYGSSKQGKTALVEKYVPYSDNVVIRCDPKSRIIDIYQSMLRQQGIEIITETENSTRTQGNLTIGAKFKALIPFIGGEASTTAQIEKEGTTKQINKIFEFRITTRYFRITKKNKFKKIYYFRKLSLFKY